MEAFMVIGITGGTGCGKSTVSKILSEKLSAPIIDADKIAHSAWTVEEILTKLCEFLGDDILIDGKEVDRRKVSAIVFNDSSKLQKLNSIIHPYVMRKIESNIISLSSKYSYILMDVPLPNNDFIRLSDFVITVWSDLETRIDRLQKRSNFTRDAIMARIKKQMSQIEYEALADAVIYNNDTIEKLSEKINEVIRNITNC
jgi:dephospho-CoA kinase